MKKCQQCNLTKPLDQFKLVSPRRVPMRFCLDCYTDNRRKSRSGEKPFNSRNDGLTRTYGITLEDYDRMLQDQNGRCAICCSSNHKGAARTSHWCVDHCHSTGKVRGLLCHACNRALGNFGDSIESLERAILYLKNQ